MIQVLNEPYIMAARARGESENRVIWRHAFRNALIPLITVLAGIIPGLFAGALVVEVIFSIPGMGRLSYDAIFSKDWPIVYGVLMLASVITLLSYLIADWLYVVCDPRIRFDARQSYRQ